MRFMYNYMVSSIYSYLIIAFVRTVIWYQVFLSRTNNFISVTWSTTERREIRNVPYPSVFELAGRQRLTTKKKNSNVGQSLAAEGTNPDQNGSQQMFALCDRMDKEWGIWTYSSPNESADRRRRR